MDSRFQVWIVVEDLEAGQDIDLPFGKEAETATEAEAIRVAVGLHDGVRAMREAVAEYEADYFPVPADESPRQYEDREDALLEIAGLAIGLFSEPYRPVAEDFIDPDTVFDKEV